MSYNYFRSRCFSTTYSEWFRTKNLWSTFTTKRKTNLKPWQCPLSPHCQTSCCIGSSFDRCYFAARYWTSARRGHAMRPHWSWKKSVGVEASQNLEWLAFLLPFKKQPWTSVPPYSNAECFSRDAEKFPGIVFFRWNLCMGSDPMEQTAAKLKKVLKHRTWLVIDNVKLIHCQQISNILQHIASPSRISPDTENQWKYQKYDHNSFCDSLFLENFVE